MWVGRNLCRKKKRSFRKRFCNGANVTAQIVPTWVLQNMFSLSLLEVRGQFKYVGEVTENSLSWRGPLACLGPRASFAHSVQGQAGGVLCQVTCS